MRLSSGFVIVGAYAKKIRKTLFAQLKDKVKDKEVSKKLAYASAQLNKLIFDILINKLKLEKGDLVRISIEYEFDESKKEVVWKPETLRVFCFKRIPQEEIEKIVQESLKSFATESFVYGTKKIGESLDGDLIYSLTHSGKDVGIAIITPLNEKEFLLKKAIVKEPETFIIEKAKLEVEENLEEALKSLINTEVSLRKKIEKAEAERLEETIRKKL
ncbi:MAG: single- stranded DNA-binding family protein [Candidatus Aenigmatarchaeota archaeon]